MIVNSQTPKAESNVCFAERGMFDPRGTAGAMR